MYVQEVLDVHIAQIERMHLRRHASRVRVPIQQVEGKRVFAQQIVVHHEGPDKIVGTQHVEGEPHANNTNT